MENYLAKQSEDGESDDANAFVDKIRYRETRKLLTGINADPSKRDELLGRDKWVSLGELKQYSDVGGEFSDYVDHIEIYIDDSRLKGLEIVDTPGLGDPVVSRSQKAHDESRTAEVVFYLSTARHFMDMEDADEFARLKKAGCRNMVLVMSQFDEVFEPEDEELTDLKDTLIYEQIADDGIKRIRDAMKRNGLDDDEPVEIVPICALGVKLSRHLSDRELAFYRSRMEMLFPDLSDVAAVNELSGIQSLQDEIAIVSQEKERIRQEFNQKMIQRCQSEVLQIYQTLLKKVEDEIAMKRSVYDEPDNALAAARVLDEWERGTITPGIDNAMGRICTMIDLECENNIKKELTAAAKSAKDGMTGATSPDSINSAYEYTFKNAVDDMFADGLEKRLRFDSGKGTYGQMFDSFRVSLQELPVPKEVAVIGGMRDRLYGELQTRFESEIHKRYTGVIGDALPHENVVKVLNSGYETVRSYSPDFKYKAKPGRKRAEKNADAIAACKKAVDDAESSIITSLNHYRSQNVRELFNTIGGGLKSNAKDNIQTMKYRLNEDKKETLKEKIEQLETVRDKLKGLDM